MGEKGGGGLWPPPPKTSSYLRACPYPSVLLHLFQTLWKPESPHLPQPLPPDRPPLPRAGPDRAHDAVG